MAVLALLLASPLPPSSHAQLTITRNFPVSENIPDAGELVNVQTLAVGALSISDLRVTLNISGRSPGSGFNGDLYAAVGHESGYAVLLNRPGKLSPMALGYSDSGLDVTFDDDAANGDIHQYRQTLSASANSPLDGPLTGLWAPDGRPTDPDAVVSGDARTALLGSFADLSVLGQWQLFIADLSSGGTHLLNSWGLEIITSPAPTSVLTFDGDSIRAEAGPQQLDNPVQLAGDATFTGAHAIEFRGATTLTGTRTLRVENTTTFTAPITQTENAAGLIKEGAGTLVLAGNNTYDGPTVVKDGTLRVQGSIASSPVIVQQGATIAGSGTIGPLTLTSGGAISPGDSPGRQTVNGDTLWEGGASYLWEINDVDAGPAAGWDLIDIAGALSITATSANPFRISITSLTLASTVGTVHDFDSRQDYFWTILTTSSGISGFSSGVFNLDLDSFGNPLDGGSFSIAQNGNNLTLLFVPVPEPAESALICGFALIGFMAIRRHKRHKK